LRSSVTEGKKGKKQAQKSNFFNQFGKSQDEFFVLSVSFAPLIAKYW
tara:strand:+ start:151867 stop:152007 length:141 start_codon:yes stop_codon:yes gene_type:complete